MNEPQELEQATDASAAPNTGAGTVSARRRREEAARHMANVEAETAQLAGMDWLALRTCLLEVVAGTRTASTEALVRICRQAHDAGDRAKLNLAFEAASKTASSLLLSQAFGQADDERAEQVQEILLQLFAAIQAGKSQQAERFFASFAKRRSIDLFRRRDARIEGKLARSEPIGEIDPIDDVLDRAASIELRVLLKIAVEKLPPKQRTAFIQYHQLGMTQEEVAQQNDVNVRTVRDWLKAARTALGYEGDENDRSDEPTARRPA